MLGSVCEGVGGVYVWTCSHACLEVRGQYGVCRCSLLYYGFSSFLFFFLCFKDSLIEPEVIFSPRLASSRLSPLPVCLSSTDCRQGHRVQLFTWVLETWTQGHVPREAFCDRSFSLALSFYNVFFFSFYVLVIICSRIFSFISVNNEENIRKYLFPVS